MISRTTKPEPQESLLGYFRRLGDLNAFIETADFFSELSCRYSRPMIEQIECLEAACGLAPGALEAISPKAASESTGRDWQYDRRWSDPVCPECLAEGQVYHQSWRHALVTACHKHEIRLQDTCTRCSEPLTPGSGGYGTCSCGLDLAQLPRVQAPAHEVLISQWIAGMAQSNSTAEPITQASKMPNDVGRFVCFLASSFLENRTGKNGKTTMPKTISDAVQLLEPVAALLQDWPRGFENHVRQRLTESSSEENSAPARLGKWYHRLMKFTDPAYDQFRLAVARVVAQEFNGSYVGGLALNDERDWLSAKEASADLGITAQRLVDAISRKQIAGTKSRSGFGHTHTVIPRFEVRNIAAERNRYCDGMSIRNLTGLSRKQFELLREAGVACEVAVQDRPALVDGGFDRMALLEHISQIRSSVEYQPGETVKLSELSLRRTTDRSALLHLFRLVFERKIKPVVADEDMALSEFEFLKSEIDGGLSTLRFSRDWTAHDVAKIAGWKPQSVVHWCRLGLLEARQVQHGPNVSYLISPEKLARFQAAFVPVATLAKSRGTSSRKLMESLAEREIPTHGAQPEGRTSRGHLVRLSDLIVIGGDDTPNSQVSKSMGEGMPSSTRTSWPRSN